MRYRIFCVSAIFFIAAAGYFFANLPALYSRVKMDRSFPALSRYVFEPMPDIALVGSSMTYRLYEGYFKTHVRNLAISGGSSLTGLTIIASYEKVPRTILVETNVMSRPVDDTLVSAFGQNNKESYKWFRPYRSVISEIYYWLKYRQENITNLLQAPPQDHDIASSVSAAEEEYKSDKPDVEMVRNTETMKHLVQQLEHRGCQIIFFEMPLPPPLEKSHYAITARTLTTNAFPNNRWINIASQEFRWLDASHLDERSAILLAKQIERTFTVPGLYGYK